MWRSVLVLSVWAQSLRRWATSPTSLSTYLSSSFLFSLCKVAKSKEKLSWLPRCRNGLVSPNGCIIDLLKTPILDKLHFSFIIRKFIFTSIFESKFLKKILCHQNNSISFQNSRNFDIGIIEASKRRFIRNGCLRVFIRNSNV